MKQSCYTKMQIKLIQAAAEIAGKDFCEHIFFNKGSSGVGVGVGVVVGGCRWCIGTIVLISFLGPNHLAKRL